ncbi:MAG TPA: ATPase domain-containing protein [Xanthomonadales bacterium]|nr:ATPase domain-containing protein [Xanthomonadales bacterium]
MDHAGTGVPGLDHILGGGLTRDRLYVIEGVPGSGKTTLALQFLMEGVARGERVLYVTLSETTEELTEVAKSHGWSLDGMGIREVIPTEASLNPDQQYTVFHPSEVELGEATKEILADVERTRPQRVVFDSLSELRLLAGNALRYRRQVLALKRFFAGRGCTVLVLDDRTDATRDLQVQSIAHGVLELDMLAPEFGMERRRLRVLKFRGRHYRGGYHDFVIRRGGIVSFPRLVAAEKRRNFEQRPVSTGIPELDKLLAGGLETGSSTLIAGGAGSGKSTLAAQIAVAAVDRGERSSMFLFDESRNTLFARARALGIPLQEHYGGGKLEIEQIDPAELSPGEFADHVRASVDERGCTVVVIDSLNGYMHAMPEERFLVLQLHELLSYLGQRGVVTVMVGVQHGWITADGATPGDITYLADAVLLLRHFEAVGEVRQALSIVKKRGGMHERTIREFQLLPGRIRVGEPLREFHGVLTGVPNYVGGTDPLLRTQGSGSA